MFSVETINFIQYFIAGFAAYLITAGLVGGFQALVCKLVGDDTPEQAGYLTVNPLVHVNMFGVICLLLMGVGFNPSMPINPFDMPRRSRTLRYAAALFSNVFASILLTAFWGFLFVIFQITEVTEHTEAFVRLGSALISTGIFFAVLNLVYDGFMLLAYCIRDKITERERDLIGWIFLFLPFLVLFFYGRYLSLFVITIINSLVNFFQGAL